MNILQYILMIFFIFYFSCTNSTESKSSPLVLNLESTHVSIFGGSDGAIDLTVTGGIKPFQYQWSNGDSTEDINNLAAGTYTVIVKDAKAQILSDSTTVNQPQNPFFNRNYLSHIPSSYTGHSAVPLVIALHYYGSNGTDFENFTGYSNLADREGFIVIYPNATGSPSEWNAGIGLTPSTLNVDDVGFISALIDTFNKNYNIDSNRVYITGFSNGSIMSYLLAAELSSKIAAIGAVAAQATSPILNALNPVRPVAIIHFHMLDDQSLSYYGGTLNGVTYPPVEDVIAAWISINNCQTQPTILLSEDGVLGRQWTSNDSYADIVLYSIDSGGHTWPSNPVSATDLIWNFFKNHHR